MGSRGKLLRWNGFGPDVREWNQKAEKEARSGKLAVNRAYVPRGTIVAWGDCGWILVGPISVFQGSTWNKPTAKARLAEEPVFIAALAEERPPPPPTGMSYLQARIYLTQQTK